MPTDAALSHATRMWEEGADIVDVGGESTRPGALPVTEAEELARIQFILAELGNREIPISIDTYKANIAARALDLGAVVVNDVWGLQKDPAMADAIAAAGAAVVIMHNRAERELYNRHYGRYPPLLYALANARGQGRNSPHPYYP